MRTATLTAFSTRLGVDNQVSLSPTSPTAARVRLTLG